MEPPDQIYTEKTPELEWMSKVIVSLSSLQKVNVVGFSWVQATNNFLQSVCLFFLYAKQIFLWRN